MAAPIDIYYDFRSPYAYLAWWRIRRQQALSSWKWRWKPVSIDVLLNLQAGREPLAPYVDPLLPPKRKHFLADIRRSAKFFGAPLSPPHRPRPRFRAGPVRRRFGSRKTAFPTIGLSTWSSRRCGSIAVISAPARS